MIPERILLHSPPVEIISVKPKKVPEMEHADFLYWSTLHPELYHINTPFGILCGYWTNGAYSPDLYIFRKDRGYWIAVIYPSGEFYVSRILKKRCI